MGESEEQLIKKVAQLTKVIVSLNNRNEDVERDKREIVEAYESEITSIVEDAKVRLKAMQDKLQDSVALAEHQRLLDEVKEQYDKQFKAAQEEWEAFRLECLKDKGAIEETARVRNQQMASLKMQVQSLREQVSAAQVRFDQALQHKDEAYEKTMSAALENQTSISSKQLESSRQRIEELTEQLAQQQSAMACAEQEAIKAKNLLTQKHKRELEELKQQHASELAKQKEHFDNAASVAASEQAVQQTKIGQLEQLLSDRAALSGNDVARLQTQLGALETDKEAVDKRLKDVLGELDAAKKALEDTKGALADAETQRDEAQKLQQTLYATVEKSKKTISDLDSYSKSQEEALETKSGEVIRLQSLVKKLMAAAKSTDSTMSDKEKAIEAAQTELAVKTSEYEEQLATLKQQHGAEIKAKDKAEKEKFENLAKEHESVVETMRGEHRRALAAAAAKHDLNLADASKEQTALRSQLESASKQLASARQQIEQLQGVSATTDGLQSQVGELQTKLEESQKEKQQLVGERDTAQERLDMVHTDLAQAEATIAQLEAELSTTMAQQDDLVANHKEQLQAQREELQSQMKQLEDRLTLEKNELKKDYSSLKIELVDAQSHLRRVKNDEASATARACELEKQLMALREQLKSLEATHSAQLEQQQAQLRASQTDTAAALESTYLAQIAELKRTHEQEQLAREKEHQAIADRLSSGVAREVEAAVSAAEATLRERHAAALEKVREKAAKDIEVTSQAAADTLEATVERLTSQNQEALAAAASEQDRLRAITERIQTDLSSKDAALVEATERITQLEHDLDFARQGLAEREANAVEELQKATLAAQRDAAELQVKHRNQVKEIVEQYRIQFEEAGRKSTQLQEQLRQMVTERTEELAQLRQMYDQRPPRDCDVDKIRDLTQQLEQTQGQLAKLAAENQRLNLEVLNREHTFNVLFKSKPQVAGSGPTPPKGAPTHRARSGKSARRSSAASSTTRS
eukprot:m.172799 g.172799  ORF g.172799 m.172799 type:complete len:985 (+) comp14581_c0_seq1:213-3167(+)